jgi:transposase-like protein
VSRELIRVLVQQCLTGPRGTIARLAAEHGVQYQTLSVAVNRERKRMQQHRHAEAA